MDILLLQMLIAGLNTTFIQRFEQYDPGWQQFGMVAPSTKGSEDYGWLGDVASMEELKDEPAPRGLKEHTFSILNKDFQVSAEIGRNMLSDDQYGQAQIRIGQLAEAARVFPANLIRTLRTAGTSGLAYDQQPFYSTTHVDGDDNLVTGTGTSDAQIQADAETALQKLWSMKTDKGKPYARANARFVAVCGPAMAIKLRRNLLLTTVSTGGQNVFAGLVSDVIVDLGLTGNDWYIDDIGAQLKAFIVQERDKVSTESTQPGSDMWVKKRKILYVANWRGNGGYGMYKNSVMINNA